MRPERMCYRQISLTFLLLAACSSGTPEPEQSAAPATPPPPSYDQVPRGAFNARAVQLALPVFWKKDNNDDRKIDPDEVALVYGLAEGPRSEWIQNGVFTSRFAQAYELIAKSSTAAPPQSADAADEERRALVVKELSQGRPTLLHHDFSGASEEDKAVVKHLLAAAQHLENLYSIQTGSVRFAGQIPADDPASRAMFFRNQGPWCLAPATQENVKCSAVPPERPKQIVDVYPEEAQAEENFCEALSKKIDPGVWGDHFATIVAKNGGFDRVPYHVAYKTQMEAIATELEAAAAAIKTGEEAFIAYLRAAAGAFRDGDWHKADEAWVAMNAQNSKWFLRIAPDETYWEPCAMRAGFEMAFALIDTGSLGWQQKLDPLKEEMERDLGKLAGPPYRARKVAFKIPDFIEIILNAGDARDATGATVGQSLPNWGPVVDEGRGRTVVMTNFYTDPDSLFSLREQAKSLFCAATYEHFTDAQQPHLMTTVLHEAAHNLGPSHDYSVGGKTDDQSFGGPLASIMEELKAQTAALFFTDWLLNKKIITEDDARRAHVRSISWAFGHISRGMYTGDGQPKTYSQLAMIQLAFLMKEKAVLWKDEVAANTVDGGCFELDFAKLPSSNKKMMTVVASIKARLDKKKGEALRKEAVDAKGELERIRGVITERTLRSPKAAFMYSIELER